MLTNRKRLDSFLEENGLSALVSSSRENTAYLTNFLAQYYVKDRMYNVVPGSGEEYIQTFGLYSGGKQVLVIPLSGYLNARMDPSVTEDIYTYGRAMSLRDPNPHFDSPEEREFEKMSNDGIKNFDSAGDALLAAISDFVGGEEIGFETLGADPHILAEVKRAKPGLAMKESRELFRFIRMVKSEEEIRRLRTAAEVNERVLERLVSSIREGVTEVDLARTFRQFLASEPYDIREGGLMIPFGTRGGAMLSAGNAALGRGMMVWIDCGFSLNGYYADLGESGVLGAPSEEQRRLYDVLTKVIEGCEEIVSPDMKPSELNAAAKGIWERGGVPKSVTGMGHGIGLEVHEYPRISAAKGEAIKNKRAIKDDVIESSIDIPFEEGMVLCLEAPYMVWGWGGVHVERTIIVGKGKNEQLTRQERFLRVIS